MDDLVARMDKTRMSHFFTVAEDEARPQTFDARPHFYVKARAEDTEGYFSMLLAPVPHQIPRHVHFETNESFFLLEGKMDMEFAGERHRITPGTFVYLPRGVPHSPIPLGDSPPVALQVSTPGGFEKFAQAQIETQMKHYGEAGVRRDFTSPEIAEVFASHDIHFVSDEQLQQFLATLD